MFKHNRAAYDVLSNTVVVENEDLWNSFKIEIKGGGGGGGGQMYK